MGRDWVDWHNNYDDAGSPLIALVCGVFGNISNADVRLFTFVRM